MTIKAGKKAACLLAGLLLSMLLMQTAFAGGSINNSNNCEVLENTSDTYEVFVEDVAGQTFQDYNEIDPSFDSQYIMAGNEVSFTIKFTNKGNHTLTLTPKLLGIPYSTNNISESWITISPANATVDPGSVQEFKIIEKIPRDTEKGDYEGQIVFNDDKVPCSTDYINSMHLSISVQAQPKIELQTTYLSDNIEVGKEYVYVIGVKNIAIKDVTIDPKMINYNPGFGQALDEDSIEISAPSIIKADEIANVTVKTNLPENATGSYNGYIDMNVNGETNDGANPQLSFTFNVWKQPVAPYIKKFNMTTNAPITIEVSADSYSSDMGLRRSPEKQKPSFELKLTHNTNQVNMAFVKSIESGSIGIGNYYPWTSTENENIYQNYNEHYVETYTVPGKIGDWELSILPKNTNNFGYSITVEDKDSAKKGNDTIKD
ncbi:MAG: hypothetical protein ACPK85_12180 [Methanosarcina sp.]